MREHLLLFLLFLIQIGLIRLHVYYACEYWPAKEIRVAELTYSPLSFFSPYGPGLDADLISDFSQKYRLKIRWLRLNFVKALLWLKQDKIDVIVGIPSLVNILDDYFEQSQFYLRNQFILVHDKSKYALEEIRELCSTKVILPASSWFGLAIHKYSNDLACPIDVQVSNQDLPFVFKSLDDNQARFMLVDRLSFQLLNPYFLDLRQTYSFKSRFKYFWLWSKRYPKLKKLLATYWQTNRTQAIIKDKKELYFGFLPQHPDYYQLYHLKKVILKRVPLYQTYIIKACAQYDLDPLFLIATIYQESHFNPQATSKTGVRGIIQLSQDTASWLGISNRLDPVQSILGGAKYLRWLAGKTKSMGATGWDKWFLALAAYNQGINHLRDAIFLAKNKGLQPVKWRSLKQIYPLLSYKKYYRRVKHGYCRGYEAISYVQKIRYYYYVLHLWAFLGGPEGNYLRKTFFKHIPTHWP